MEFVDVITIREEKHVLMKEICVDEEEYLNRRIRIGILEMNEKRKIWVSCRWRDR